MHWTELNCAHRFNFSSSGSRMTFNIQWNCAVCARVFERTPGVFRRLHYIIRTCRSGIDVMMQQQLNFKFTFCSSNSNQTNGPTFFVSSRGELELEPSQFSLGVEYFWLSSSDCRNRPSNLQFLRLASLTMVCCCCSEKKRVENPFCVHRLNIHLRIGIKKKEKKKKEEEER